MKIFTFVISLMCILPFSAMSQDVTQIPLPDEFVTTLDVTNEYPMVRTGYLASSVEAISQFYLQALGEPIKSKGNNTYKTLYYNYQERSVRISLYHHNYVTEVSIMIE
ncbi:hypothetical protein CWC11_10445 [Pseudoalteromonas sp. S3178]|uniref:hypothetical protein n=1 Tax=Pseudoalteromonas sp. S3178 TaxID=579532 RepID=UPI00110AC142|nr:hypothetical protein [Pseudoalteromonas sp. S3178]TMP05136.1 hypothetical protein CWC11_10445 [Pseudoalteromonas sp. S3178]